MDVSINLLQAICRTNHTYDEGISELARRLGQSPQNFGKKLKRETITLEELKAIADVMNVKFEQAFILPDGNEIKTRN